MTAYRPKRPGLPVVAARAVRRSARGAAGGDVVDEETAVVHAIAELAGDGHTEGLATVVHHRTPGVASLQWPRAVDNASIGSDGNRYLRWR